MGKKYTIGVDFGTQSARAVLADVSSGEVAAQAVHAYPHGVMDQCLPDQTPLPPGWALEHPADFVEALERTVPAVMAASGIPREDVIAISTDFTSCTLLGLDREGAPVCFQERFRSTPHAYAMLWKHHGAQKQNLRFDALAREWDEPFLERSGGRSCAEFLFPKLMQILEEAPQVFEATDRFMEAGDWMTFLLCGAYARNICSAAYKGSWSKAGGYPGRHFLAALDPRLAGLCDTKLRGEIFPLGHRAGGLLPHMAEKLGLLPGIPVGVSCIDAHVAPPAVGITQPGKLLMIIGTSTALLNFTREEHLVPGILRVAEDGIIPGLFGYESGQTCAGDHFEWFVERCVPQSYWQEARERGGGIHGLLTKKASALRPGESGLLALDWWNGNRSILIDAELTGLLVGLTLQTRPEEIYRALIEATGYGLRTILENFEEHGVELDQVFAAGGISKKNPLLMQIYADILDREIFIAQSDQCSALGAALYAAVAAGRERGGYDTVFEAAQAMGHVEAYTYKPIPENVEIYHQLYDEYKQLHDYFGRGGNDVMKRLGALRLRVKNK